jgi:hypothetical protein
MESEKRCPYCGERILAVAIKCKHCASDLSASPSAPLRQTQSTADFGWALLGIPVAGTLLIWGWVLNLSMFQGPGGATGLVVATVVIGTAAIASIEAAKLGMRTDSREDTFSPTEWALMILLIWIIGYPAYLYKRRRYGRSNLLLGGIFVAAVFVGSAAFVYTAIDHHMADLLRSFERLQLP